MALFDTKLPLYGYRVVQEGEDSVMRINYETAPMIPSVEDNPLCMAKTIESLAESGSVSKIVFMQKRDYEYGLNATILLKEVAKIYSRLIKEKELFSHSALAGSDTAKPFVDEWYIELQNLLYHTLKSDPIGAYVQIKRIIRREHINLQKIVQEDLRPLLENYLRILSYIAGLLDTLKIVTIAKPYLQGHVVGDRDIYRRFFHPTIKPDFMFTKLMANYPLGGIELDNYTLDDDTEVTIFSLPDSVQYVYHLMPPEFKLTEEQYEVLDLARTILAEHKPTKQEFTDPARMREVFINVGRDLIEELISFRKVKMSEADVAKLSRILVRYTIGFGLIEVLLQDELIQDISVNSPQGRIPLFIVHAKYDDCKTNIIPTVSEAESWATKLRLISGRPLDEANTILDTELELPGATVRVSTITRPLSPSGLAFSFRRHRDRPWTLPLFVKHKTITPLTAGLISFLIDGTRSMMVCGTRSSGKSSFLSAMLIEIMRRHRIITIEDTLELPTASMRKLGFNIQPMKVASALQRGSSEMSAGDGIRSTLRLGDSALIVGEVRSKEAAALYEAMRVGAAANVVAGTIHADSPFGLYDRVVNDIGIPKTSFKATDIVIVLNPIKSADGLHKVRRCTQITEIRKDWQEDPLLEGGFVDLFKYNAKTDELDPTDALLDGDSEVLKMVAANIPDFVGNWDALWKNVELRAKTKMRLVEKSKEINDPELLEAEFVIRSNDQFHIITERVKRITGMLDPDKIYAEWHAWLETEIKRRKTHKEEFSSEEVY